MAKQPYNVEVHNRTCLDGSFSWDPDKRAAIHGYLRKGSKLEAIDSTWDDNKVELSFSIELKGTRYSFWGHYNSQWNCFKGKVQWFNNEEDTWQTGGRPDGQPCEAST